MQDRVDQHWNDHKVRRLDYCMNGVLIAVGLGMVAFSIAMIVLTSQHFGYSSKLIPFYALYSGVGVSGCALTLFSIKWMIRSCEKSREYDRHIY